MHQPDRADPTDAPSEPERIDIALSRRLARHKDQPIMRALGAASSVGDQEPLLAISSAVLGWGLVAGHPRLAAAGVRMVVGLAVATALKSALKRAVSRTRPHVLLDEGVYEVRPFGPDEGPWHSFPSGHTAGSVAVARALGRTYPAARAPAYAGAAAIAAVQVPCGRHYPADVAAGLVVGVVAEAIGEWALERLADRVLAASPPPEGEVSPADATRSDPTSSG